MEGAKYFIELYKMNETTYRNPDIKQENVYIHPIKKLDKDLLITKSLGFKTTFIWYIKPKVKTP